MSGKWYIAPVVMAIVAVMGVGCSSNNGTNGTSTIASSLATSPAVVKAKEQATTCLKQTSVHALLSSSGRDKLLNCLESIVPPAKREAFKNCVTSAATSDRVWTSEGRTKFINESIPNCVDSA